MSIDVTNVCEHEGGQHDRQTKADSRHTNRIDPHFLNGRRDFSDVLQGSLVDDTIIDVRTVETGCVQRFAQVLIDVLQPNRQSVRHIRT